MQTGLLGYPIDHSLSPVMHNAAYQELGLDWHYSLYPCKTRKDFESTLRGFLKDPGTFVGMNVTTPYKVAAFEAAAQRSPLTQVVGNANVLTLMQEGDLGGVLEGTAADAFKGAPDGALEGAAAGGAFFNCDNTDGQGLVSFLERDAGVEVNNCSFVICGTGSVALSTLSALIERQAAGVTLASRDKDSAQIQVDALIARFLTRESGGVLPPIRVVDYATVVEPLATTQVLIDATTLGMDPQDGSVIPVELIRADMVVFDVVYGHGQTALLKGAQAQGAQAFDGLGMLIEQAALSLEIWAKAQGKDITAPRAVMTQACQNAL